MSKAFNADGNELFQIAWLKIKEAEIKGKDFSNVTNHKNYFFLTLRNVFIDLKRHEKNNIALNEKISIEDTSEQVNNNEPCQADLIEWMYEEVKNEDELFYKNVLILQTQIKKHKDVQEKTTMNRKTYWKARKIAQQKAKDEIIDRITNTNDSQCDCLV